MKLNLEYDALTTDRETYLRSAEACAQVTIPKLFEEEHKSKKEAEKDFPWQSVGAQGVSSLAAKLVQALFPTNVPFFRMTLSQDEANALLEELQDPTVVEQIGGEIQKLFSKYELEAVKIMEERGDRPKHYQVFEQLLVAGNCLIKDTRVSRDFSIHRLHSFVVSRDDTGRLQKVILKEDLSKESLMLVPSFDKGEVTRFLEKDCNRERKKFCMYTGAILEDGKYKVTQQVYDGNNEENLESSGGTFPEWDLPIRPLRLYEQDCEHYSRSYVSNYLGDLRTLDGLYQALSEGTAAASRFLWLVNPNSSLDLDQLADAPNGAAVHGNPEDINPLTADGKVRDLQSVMAMTDRIERRMEQNFLLHSSVQRSGERVTATEIGSLIKELEGQLGGVYSLMAQEYQRPYVQHLLSLIKALPKLPKDKYETAIVSGSDALGRTEELSRMDQFMGRVAQHPEGLNYVNTRGWLETTAQNLGIRGIETLLKSDEQLQQEQQAALQAQQQQTLLDKGTGPAIQAISQSQPQA